MVIGENEYWRQMADGTLLCKGHENDWKLICPWRSVNTAEGLLSQIEYILSRNDIDTAGVANALSKIVRTRYLRMHLDAFPLGAEGADDSDYFSKVARGELDPDITAWDFLTGRMW